MAKISESESVKSEAEKQQDFYREYEELCKRHSLQLVPVPQYKQSADTGAWLTIILLQAAKLPNAN